jgi:hypothetical protein
LEKTASHFKENGMNPLIISAGIIALLTTAGHFTVGRKMYLKPLLESDIQGVPKKVLHCVFHYVSTFLILSTLALFVSGSMKIGRILAFFIAVNYSLFAVWQLALVKRSGIKRGPLKMFQWIFFVLIAALGFLGAILWDVF